MLRTIAVLLLLALMTTSMPILAQQCADGLDNNNNGQVDMADPYCRSPTDNDESSFASGIPGDDVNSPASLDCWFDDNSGSGNDDCIVHACCSIDGPCPANLSPETFDPNECQVSQMCIETCQPITKPDCDCFGCCNICPPGQSCTRAFVHPAISPGCSLESLGTAQQCLPCSGNLACRAQAIDVFEDGFELLLLQ